MIEEKTAGSEAMAAAKEEKAAAKNTGKPMMRIKVYSPFHTYYDDDSYSITGVNHTGPFDILPHHHNFMTLLDPCELVIEPVNGQEQRIRISSGLMHVKADKVTVFLDV